MSLIVSVSGFSQTEDVYGGLSDTFSIFADSNSGLTIFPTLMIPLGGLFEGMGTAYTAVSVDSGYLEANPAGSAMLDYSELSLVHHNWIADSNIEGIMYTFRIDDIGIGIGGKFLYMPFTSYSEIGLKESSGYISESIGTFNISYNVLSNYYFSGISVGTSVKLAYRNIPDVFYLNQSAFAAMVDVGILSRFDFLKFYNARANNFSIGLTLKNVGLASLADPLPTLFTAGIAYSFMRPLLIAVDFNLPVSFNPDAYPAETWYVAAGVHLNVTKFFSMHAGMRIKENPFISIGCNLDFPDISLVANYNLDLSGSINPLDKMSVEAKIKLGYREHETKRRQVDDLLAKGIESYARGDFAQAIRYWELALEFDPKFSIAADYIKTTKDYLQLQDQMKEKQKFPE